MRQLCIEFDLISTHALLCTPLGQQSRMKGLALGQQPGTPGWDALLSLSSSLSALNSLAAFSSKEIKRKLCSSNGRC
jgi:hypothetical protein